MSCDWSKLLSGLQLMRGILTGVLSSHLQPPVFIMHAGQGTLRLAIKNIISR